MDGISRVIGQLLRFAWLQARCCAFAVALIGGIAVSALLPELPVARYDLVLVYGVLLAVLARKLGWDGSRDTVVIAACHVIGLLFELVKVRLGSWSYPEAALTKVAGVPLYGGFLYAAVGSYVCRAWRMMDLHLTGYRPRIMAVLAAAVYLNFFTHHWLPDLRWPLAAALLWATAGSRVCYRVGASRHHMPLCVSFVLIGFFLWVAENAATFAGAWSYPDQLDGWQPVTISKAAAWALLISVTFVLVASSRRAVAALPPGEAGAEGSGDDAGAFGHAETGGTKIGDTGCATGSTSSTSAGEPALRACCGGRGTRRSAASASP
ncbi:hypothetical protein GCM10012287_03360 [Streptomyces daqingensis]|uniref:DUF817 domain-containing protein n=1 Tax=Streptomyces daqingensis TaxID=1472640 RepID=A0ABQ2LRW2_9ACTN|nr:hypothetical protein GCM10012287_03360 [Streptomyces daqingensis]